MTSSRAPETRSERGGPPLISTELQRGGLTLPNSTPPVFYGIATGCGVFAGFAATT